MEEDDELMSYDLAWNEDDDKPDPDWVLIIGFLTLCCILATSLFIRGC